MAQLGETQDATALVPGNPGIVRANAKTLDARAASAESAGDGLIDIDIDTGAWQGKAGDAFCDKFSYGPTKWYDAANSLQTAANALTTYADVLEWAQRQAVEAIRLWNEAEARSEQARREYDQALAQAAPGQSVAPYVD
ncbi:putative T7SS-secreted protein [Krasilnikovia sp. M28-CT-15]|uniref:putative T7SS-secreted protein n=1 Tax=Krasilnikovia sp. M28-CT-15 TaxID=3373540 RepID=UPI003876B9F7